MDLIDCKRQNIIKKTIPNKSLIKSLIEMSDTKELAVTTAVITDKTISAYISRTNSRDNIMGYGI